MLLRGRVSVRETTQWCARARELSIGAQALGPLSPDFLTVELTYRRAIEPHPYPLRRYGQA
jgi:hypothetical protein